jgi:hypothetical protein
MDDCEARAGGLYALEDRNGLGRCPCWLRQLLLERSDGHRPDEVCGQREAHVCVERALNGALRSWFLEPTVNLLREIPKIRLRPMFDTDVFQK